MNKENIPKGETGFAEFFSVTSRGLKFAPILDKLIVGKNNVPEGWQHINESAYSFEPWIRFPGDPEGTRLPIPRLYRMVGIISVESGELAALQLKEEGSRYAVAVQLGHAVVVGALGENVNLALDCAEQDRLIIGARISHYDLYATAGIWIPDSRKFVKASSSHSAGSFAKSEVPSTLPIV